MSETREPAKSIDTDHPQTEDERRLSRRGMLQMGAFGAAGVGLAGLAACSPGEEAQKAEDPIGEVAGTESDAEAGARITKKTLEHAEKLFDVEYSDAEREQVIETIDGFMARLRALRGASFANDEAPALTFDPRPRGFTMPQPLLAQDPPPAEDRALPDDTAVAYASIAQQQDWMRRGLLTSRRLTEIYLARIDRFAAQLECIVTLRREAALAEADKADRERAEGRVRSPLHGIPYGLKDLFDTEGETTTWGAEPYKTRRSDKDAEIVRLLREAGAVLLAKTTLGAIAYGDIWFDGRTRNPWNLLEGSSGSSAGSAAGTAAGLFSFAIGTETLGSLVSPSNRCGCTTIRPSFGRVSRAGAMALCWSLDKVGPICRHVDDAAQVLSVLSAFDAADPSSLAAPALSAHPGPAPERPVVGYRPEWFENGSPVDKAALETAKAAGARMKEITLPSEPLGALLMTLEAEAAAAFEELTLSDRDDELTWQIAAAWPNTWRRARFISAVDLIQADRLRRRVMGHMAQVFEEVDFILGPNYAGAMLLITNYTGHPQLALKAGFIDSPARTNPASLGPDDPNDPVTYRVPQTVSLWGRLYEEDRLLAFARDLEARLGAAADHPDGFR